MWKRLGAALLLMGSLACAGNPPPQTIPTSNPPVPTQPHDFDLPLHLGVVGSYHGPLGTADLQHLASYGAFTIRAAVSSKEQAQQIVDALKPYHTLTVLWLVEGANDQLVKDLIPILLTGPTVGIELGNELDLAGLTPTQFGQWITRSYTVLRAAGFTREIISGGTFSVQPATLRWIQQSGIDTWPADITLGVHRYGDPDTGQQGYSSRVAETVALQQLVKNREIAVTEFGYPTRTGADEEWEAQAVAKDLAAFKQLGADSAYLYQITDGTGTGNLDHFGLHTVDGRWKPVERNFLPGPVDVPEGQLLAFDLVACSTSPVGNYCAGPAKAQFKLHTGLNPDTYLTLIGDGNGYVFVQGFVNVPDSDLTITAEGFQPYVTHISPRELVAINAAGKHNLFQLIPAHVDPSGIALEQIARIRGAMWPQSQGDCGNFTIGPRPGQDTNIFATDFLSSYSEAEQDCGIAMLKARGYTHVVMGPLVDSDGYHGVWVPRDWRGLAFQEFLDVAQKFWDNGLTPVVFIHPDGWTLERDKSEFTPLLQDPRAQKLIRAVVPHGWEPCKYECSSQTWREYGRWARESLPNALVLLHTVADVDAPVGTDSLGDDNGHPNAEGWARVLPYYHGWLTQSSAFADPAGHGDPGQPTKTNFQNWQDLFNPNIRGSYRDRFEHGYAGWPTFSAWGPNHPVTVYDGESSAYWRFWANRSEAEGVQWGNAAIAAGAAGYLDGGSVQVP